MRYYLVSILLLLYVHNVFAQQNNGNRLPGTGATYAVVVGISTYQNKGIRQLEFAHKDALVFSTFLESKAGGNVPESNIILLLNEKATFEAIYEALDNLMEKCRSGDKVYFYFSGHGDMENTTMFNLGFLLGYNTPRTNFINNAVRIEDLNNIANTLSVKKNVKVIIITDACHSGAIAGEDNRGALLVGEQLRATQDKEIRITSCARDQLSVEDEGWDGGRGVFSYYLIKGLAGLADKSHDKIISLSEIRNYLDSSMGNDVLLKQKGEVQTPVIKGNDQFNIAVVDSVLLAKLNRPLLKVGQGMVSNSMLKPLSKQPQAYFFEAIEQQNLENIFDFDALLKLDSSEIPFTMIKRIRDSAFDEIKANSLINLLRENAYAYNQFKNKLIELMSNRGQEIINDYLEADEAELERRRYYNSKMNGYDVYPKMFATALKLSPTPSLSRILKIKYFYFSGVAERIKIPLVENPADLLKKAMAFQLQALALEENAACIQNELGILYQMQEDNKKAEQFFKRAAEISPNWVVPLANLAGLYAIQNKFSESQQTLDSAFKVQPGYQGNFLNAGVLNERKSNWLFAEEFYRRSIAINSRHYLPFERLGFVYLFGTDYALSDSFFLESERRKMGYHFKPPAPKVQNVVMLDAVTQISICKLDTVHLKKEDVLTYFVWGISDFQRGNFKNAERVFKILINYDKTNPLAFHYLAKIMVETQRWTEAELMYTFAKKYWLPVVKLDHYRDSALRYTKVDKDCIKNKFSENYYEQEYDFFESGELYESWNHLTEGENEYKTLIEMNYKAVAAHERLWKLLESEGRYEEAEVVLKKYCAFGLDNGENELAAFYKRMISKFPSNGWWYYKAGIQMYLVAAANPQGFLKDHKQIKLDSNGLIEDAPFDERPKVSFGNDDHNVGIYTLGDRATAFERPRSEGISFLEKADSLLSSAVDFRGDLQNKLGDLYVWIGLPSQASLHYKESLDLFPQNASVRMKLVSTASETYYFSIALEQLDSLFHRNEINFDNQLLMAKYCMLCGRNVESQNLLLDAEKKYPYKLPIITDLKGRAFLLNGDYENAISFYEEFLGTNQKDAVTMYSIARLYALMGENGEATKWLKKSLDRGFHYYWVLKYDPGWDKIRACNNFKLLSAGIAEPTVKQL